MMEVVVTTAAIRSLKSSPPTNQHPFYFTGRMSFLLPNQQCQSTDYSTYSDWSKSHPTERTVACCVDYAYLNNSQHCEIYMT